MLKIRFINFLHGYTLLKAEGVFCERIINIAGEYGIFVWGLKRLDELTVTFFVSRKGADKLLASDIPSNLSLTKEKSFGLPAIFSKYKKRRLLFICPFLAAAAVFASTRFIWYVNVVTDDPSREALILEELKALGVKRGALKSAINQGEIKRKMMLSDDSLLWIWVDIKGSSAIVRLAERTKAPEVFDEDGFYNIYSLKDAVITRITATGGAAKVSVGDTALKGQLLIEGSMLIGEDETKYIHASGEVYGSVWEEKTALIPKQTEIRTPTGRKKERLKINFSKFDIKLFINSSIEYQKYDIIEEVRPLLFLPVSFAKTTYREVTVAYSDNDTNALVEDSKRSFSEELGAQGFTVTYIEAAEEDAGDNIRVTLRALCEENIAAERRMYLGEDNSVTEP